MKTIINYLKELKKHELNFYKITINFYKEVNLNITREFKDKVINFNISQDLNNQDWNKTKELYNNFLELCYQNKDIKKLNYSDSVVKTNIKVLEKMESWLNESNLNLPFFNKNDYFWKITLLKNFVIIKFNSNEIDWLYSLDFGRDYAKRINWETEKDKFINAIKELNKRAGN